MLTIEQIKNTVTDYFKDKPVKKVYLFGSYARGEAKENSDVDLGVVIDDSHKRMSLWQYAGIAMGLEEMLHVKVDMVELHLMHNWVKESFEQDRIEIYTA